MKAELDVQYATAEQNLPTLEDIQTWVDTCLSPYAKTYGVCVRIVDNPESQQLNSQYRNKHKPTNVLSFVFETPECVDQTVEMIGDLVICAPVVAQEASDQNKQLFDHWAHMVIHGILHLLGFDHIEAADAEEMERLERELLAKLQITDPYLQT